MMRGFASALTFSLRSRGVSAAHAPRRAHLSRQVYQSHQVASCERQLVMCVHAIQSTHHCTAHRRPRLRPSVDPFGHLPLDLADLIPRMAAGACVNRAAASASCVLCHMRGDLSFSTLGHEVGRIVVFVSPQGAASGALRRRTAFSHFVHQRQRGFALGGAGGARQCRGHRKAMPVLCERVSQVGQMGFAALTLLVEPPEFVNDDETPWDVNLMSVAATFC